MTKPRIEEMVEEFEQQMPLMTAHGKLLCATASPSTYKKIKDWLRTALTEAHQAGIDEASLDKEIDLTTAALMGMLTAGFPEELANKHASLIAKSIMKNPSVEREALQDNK